MKKIVVLLSAFIVTICASAKERPHFNDHSYNSLRHEKNSVPLKHFTKETAKFEWTCWEIQLTCTCGELCGEYSGGWEGVLEAGQDAMYWEALLCPGIHM